MKAPDTSDNMSLNFPRESTLKLRYHVCVFSHRTSVFLYLENSNTSDSMSLNFPTESTSKLRYHVCVFSHGIYVFLYLENSNTSDNMSLKFPTISTLKLRYHVLLTDGNKCWEEKKYHFLGGKYFELQ